MRKKSVLNYSGVLSVDTEKRLVKPENHIEAKNVYGTPTEYGGSLYVAPGAAKVNLDSILSTYTIVGTFEEKTTNKVYFLVYVPGGEDRVYLYDPLDQTADNGTVRELCRFTGLDLNTQYLAQGEIIDGKFLVWTESNQIKETIESNGIKKINLERADTNKRFKYRIAVTQDSNPDEDHYYRFYDVNGNPTAPAVMFYSPVTGEGSVQDRLDAIASALNAVSGIGAVAFKNYVEVTMVTAGVRLLVYSDGTTAQDGLTDWPDAKYNGQSLLFWAYNHYPLATTRNMFDLCKQPFPCAPYHEFQENPDPLDKFADIKDGAWQFIIRLHYIDGETSAWSEPSIIATRNKEIDNEYPFTIIDEVGDQQNVLLSWPSVLVDDTQNMIVLRYGNDLIYNETQLSLISHVEIAVREGTEKVYYQLDKKPIEDCISEVFSYPFLNDRKGPAVQSDDAYSDIETQVLKKFDWVPRGAGCIGLIDEEGGNGKIVIGSPLEGYDNIAKADCSVEFVFTEDLSDRTLHHHLKERGEYKFGIEYLDDFGRVSDVIHALDITVPDHHINGSKFFSRISQMSMSINHQAPSWATKYRIVRTNDLKHRDFYQFMAVREDPYNDWKYAQYDEDFDGKFKASSITDATHFMIRLPNVSGSVAGEYVVFDDLELNSYFTPQKGDRFVMLKSILREIDVLDPIPQEPEKWESFVNINKPIVGVHNDIEGNKWVIVEKFQDSFFVAPSGNWFPQRAVYVCEVYRQKVTEEFAYFETGNCHDVYASAGKYYHRGDQDQTGSDPAIVQIMGGDANWFGLDPYAKKTLYFGPSDVPIYFTVESSYSSEAGSNKSNSIGRANLEDSIEERYVFNRFRHSQLYQTNSKINGINSFRGIDLVDTNISYGPISGLKMSGDTLLAVCFNKIQPIYLNRENVLSINNASQLGTSSRQFTFASELRGDYGSQHKESILSEHGRIYAWDKRTSVIWRYDVNGVNDIRIDTVSLFAPIGDYRKSSLIYLDRVFTGYDRRRDLFFIFFKEINRDGINRTFIFDEKKNGWRSELEMIPQMFCQVNDKLLSYYENQLYVHDGIGSIPANYHGYQTIPSVKKVFNEEPTSNKIPWAATTQSRYVWEFDPIESPPSKHYEEGQLSRIRSENWKNLSGHWSAPFMRDMNDTKAEFLAIPNFDKRQKTALLRGRHLRGDHFILSLRMVEPDNDILFSTEIEYSIDTKE